MQTRLTGIAFNIITESLQLLFVAHDSIVIFVLPNCFVVSLSLLKRFPGKTFPRMQNL